MPPALPFPLPLPPVLLPPALPLPVPVPLPVAGALPVSDPELEPGESVLLGGVSPAAGGCGPADGTAGSVGGGDDGFAGGAGVGGSGSGLRGGAGGDGAVCLGGEGGGGADAGLVGVDAGEPTCVLSTTRGSLAGAEPSMGGSPTTIGPPDGAAATGGFVTSFLTSGSGAGSKRERRRA